MPDDAEYVLTTQSLHGVLDELVWYFPGVHMTHICDATTRQTHANKRMALIKLYAITFIYIPRKLHVVFQR